MIDSLTWFGRHGYSFDFRMRSKSLVLLFMDSMDGLPKFEHFEVSNPFNLMEEDFDVHTFQRKPESDGDTPPEVEEQESTEEEENRGEGEFQERVHTKVKKSAKKRRRVGDLSGRQMAKKKIEEEKKRGKFAFGYEVPRFHQALKEARELFLRFCNGAKPSEDHASAMRSYFYQKYQVCITVS